ncbi:MAG TPA: hypothetical protein VNX67_01910 [Solirubrobacteraceae bacterium]|nr:hypothetical protein [Solirubrobacteraceae bacterium]
MGLAGVALAAAVGYSHAIWWVPDRPSLHSELRLGLPQVLCAGANVLFGVGVLAMAAWRALAWGPAERSKAVLA